MRGWCFKSLYFKEQIESIITGSSKVDFLMNLAHDYRHAFCGHSMNIGKIKLFMRGRNTSVDTALDCRAEGRGFDSQGRTNNTVLK